MKSFITLLLFLATLPAFAIRHVGNGGGEAEMKVLKFYESLPVWLKGCIENPDLCVKNNSSTLISELLSELLSELQILASHQQRTLVFVPKREKRSICDNNSIYIGTEDLYIDETYPKSDHQLFLVLYSHITQCLTPVTSMGDFSFLLLPNVKSIPSLSISIISGSGYDLLVSHFTDQNLHAEVTKKVGTSRFLVRSKLKNAFILTTATGDKIMQITSQNRKIEFSIKHFHDIDP